MATAVVVEGGGLTLGKRDLEEGKQQGRGRSSGKKKKARVQHQSGVQSDKGLGWQATGVPGGKGQGGPGASNQGGVPRGNKG